MADYRLRIEAEHEATETALACLPGTPLAGLTKLELAGVAAMLHNFYNGIKNVLRQTMQSKALFIPRGDSSHRDLLLAAHQASIVSAQLVEDLKPYLAFRHFFSHGYALDLIPQRTEPLVREAPGVIDTFRAEIGKALA